MSTSETLVPLEQVVIKFAGDSGDGMQLTGTQFTNTAALFGNDLGTFPDFPAEIRAPQGTTAGVSGYQLHFGSTEIYTPGDMCDVLVVMNAAALKMNLKQLKRGGIIIANIAGFDAKNLRLANVESNQLEDNSLDGYEVYKVDVTKLTRDAIADLTLGTKEKDRCKNMFVLGFLYWMFDRDMQTSINFLNEKFSKKTEILEANLRVLKAGYAYGETTETFSTRFKVEKAKMPAGKYRNIMGNQALALGIVAASHQSGLPVFLGSYPITPASDVLHELAKYKNFNIRTFQAEDEIAGICSAIGASFGGQIGLTTTSGPGMALKTEAMGLAVMLEVPLVICNIQRAGPSTGMPTKTEQADLLQAYYGRNGECPIPVIAAQSPSDCFRAAFEACKIAVQHMTPVILLSDGYIANGAEPWRYPVTNQLEKIEKKFAAPSEHGEKFMPYARDEKLSRPWAVPGTKGLEHRIGGLEKQNITGNISYDAANHEQMVKLREEKVEKIADYLPEQKIDSGKDSGKVLVLGWGGTYGALKAAVKECIAEGMDVSHTHIRYIKPFPKNLEALMKRFDKVLIPEINNGQLIRIIRDRYLIPAIPFNKIQGVPFMKGELVEKIKEVYNTK
ncbi:2-oxoglutarate ferredoxin oxidoreductase subunit alpha [Bacteroidota bacterium]|nr:2-oxoglutarate ferredoxin oxidoreductase subunit alpha [Bacteroidota bacterium]